MASQAIPLSNSDEPGSHTTDSLVASLTTDIEKLGLVASSLDLYSSDQGDCSLLAKHLFPTSFHSFSRHVGDHRET